MLFNFALSAHDTTRTRSEVTCQRSDTLGGGSEMSNKRHCYCPCKICQMKQLGQRSDVRGQMSNALEEGSEMSYEIHCVIIN